MPEVDYPVEWSLSGEVRVPKAGEWYLAVGYSGGGLGPVFNNPKVPYEQVAPILKVSKTQKRAVEIS